MKETQWKYEKKQQKYKHSKKIEWSCFISVWTREKNNSQTKSFQTNQFTSRTNAKVFTFSKFSFKCFALLGSAQRNTLVSFMLQPYSDVCCNQHATTTTKKRISFHWVFLFFFVHFDEVQLNRYAMHYFTGSQTEVIKFTVTMVTFTR